MPSSTAVDWPAALPYPLVGPTRSFEPRNEVHAMESGRVRIRKYYEDILEVHDFEWAFTADEFETFKAFFEDDLLHGEYPFVITLPDPDDSSMETEVEMGFHELGYQWSHSDGVYMVRAVMLVELETITVIEEFFAELCGVVIWPAVSDGEGGGTTFDCYVVGRDYVVNQMQPAGTGINVVYRGNSIYSAYGEDFETFAEGALVLGSPSSGSELSVMRYGTSLVGNHVGDDLDTWAVGAVSDSAAAADSGLGNTYEGEYLP